MDVSTFRLDDLTKKRSETNKRSVTYAVHTVNNQVYSLQLRKYNCREFNFPHPFPVGNTSFFYFSNANILES